MTMTGLKGPFLGSKNSACLQGFEFVNFPEGSLMKIAGSKGMGGLEKAAFYIPAA